MTDMDKLSVVTRGWYASNSRLSLFRLRSIRIEFRDMFVFIMNPNNPVTEDVGSPSATMRG